MVAIIVMTYSGNCGEFCFWTDSCLLHSKASSANYDDADDDYYYDDYHDDYFDALYDDYYYYDYHDGCVDGDGNDNVVIMLITDDFYDDSDENCCLL